MEWSVGKVVQMQARMDIAVPPPILYNNRVSTFCIQQRRYPSIHVYIYNLVRVRILCSVVPAHNLTLRSRNGPRGGIADCRTAGGPLRGRLVRNGSIG